MKNWREIQKGSARKGEALAIFYRLHVHPDLLDFRSRLPLRLPFALASLGRLAFLLAGGFQTLF
jgi:hypothetical protein